MNEGNEIERERELRERKQRGVLIEEGGNEIAESLFNFYLFFF